MVQLSPCLPSILHYNIVPHCLFYGAVIIFILHCVSCFSLKFLIYVVPVYTARCSLCSFGYLTTLLVMLVFSHLLVLSSLRLRLFSESPYHVLFTFLSLTLLVLCFSGTSQVLCFFTPLSPHFTTLTSFTVTARFGRVAHTWRLSCPPRPAFTTVPRRSPGKNDLAWGGCWAGARQVLAGGGVPFMLLPDLTQSLMVILYSLVAFPWVNVSYFSCPCHLSNACVFSFVLFLFVLFFIYILSCRVTSLLLFLSLLSYCSSSSCSSYVFFCLLGLCIFFLSHCRFVFFLFCFVSCVFFLCVFGLLMLIFFSFCFVCYLFCAQVILFLMDPSVRFVFLSSSYFSLFVLVGMMSISTTFFIRLVAAVFRFTHVLNV